MNQQRKYYYLIVLIAALIIAFLLNVKTFWHIGDLLQTKNYDELDIVTKGKLWFGIKQFIIQFFYFLGITFFNFKSLFQARKNVLRIVYNVSLFFGIAILESYTLTFHLKDSQSVNLSTVFFLFMNVLPHILALGLAYILFYHQQNIQLPLLENQLKEAKSKAELTVLKEQISPHFMFNTLNSLSAVIRTQDKEQSLEFVEKLSDVYRYILEREKQDLVTLREELDFLEAYFFLLKKRFGNNLTLEIEIEAPLFSKKIPPLALQLLLENVIKHNKLMATQPIEISIKNKDNTLIFYNSQNKKPNTEGYGLGLSNLQKRFQLIAQKDILIEQNEHTFSVTLPIL